MITLTCSRVRQLRSVFHRSALGIAHEGVITPLVIHAGDAQLRAHHRYCDLAVAYVDPGGDGPRADAEIVLIPLDALADFAGAANTPVVLEAVTPDRTAVYLEDRGIPQAGKYDVTPVVRTGTMPGLPAV